MSKGTDPMTSRRAACSCGQLHLTIAGEPVRISMCHCLECQRRTGAVLSNQARFPRDQITFAGKATAWTRMAESGNKLTFHFCPICGSTVYWENEGFPGIVAIAIGNSPTRISRRQPSRCGRSRVTPGSLCRRTFRRSERRSRADRLTASKGRLGSRAPGFPSLPPVADMERTSRHLANGPTAEVRSVTQ